MGAHSRLLALCLAAAAVSLGGCKADPDASALEAQEERQAQLLAKRMQAACSSPATYDRLKQIAFDEAIRIRNADPVNLETLATHSLVRVEEPRVVSRNETLDVTVCRGRFILQVPPGAERAFGGERQLTANIEYAAQAAADGSGLVYQIEGAEPIIYKLAAFDLRGQASPAPTRVAQRQAPQAAPAEAAPAPQPAAARTARPDPAPTRSAATARAAPEPRPASTSQQAQASPSFNCRHARTATERMVCGSGDLASLDRTMASGYYAALDVSDERTRAELRRSRDRFLASRERCDSEACVAQSYRDRMAEIDAIAGR